MSFILLGILNSQAAGGGALGSPYIGLGTSAGSGHTIYHFGNDADNNSFFASYGSSARLYKIDPSGTLLASKRFNDTQNYGATVDADGNVYSVLQYGSPRELFLIKFDNDLNIVWQKKYFDATFSGLTHRGITYNPVTDKVILVATENSGSDTIVFDVTPSTGSTGVYQFAYNNGSYVAVNPTNGDIYITGSNISGAFNCLKLNSSYTAQWAYSYAGPSSALSLGIAVDDSGNAYIGGEANGSGLDPHILKVNSSGAVQWGMRVSPTAAGQTPYGLAYADGYVYQTANGYQSQYQMDIYKVDASTGGINWQRRGYIPSTTTRGYSIEITDDGTNFLATGQSNAGLPFFKAPVDGSLTGTYAIGASGYSWVYGATSYSTASVTFTATARSTSTVAPSIAQGTGSELVPVIADTYHVSTI